MKIVIFLLTTQNFPNKCKKTHFQKLIVKYKKHHLRSHVTVTLNGNFHCNRGTCRVSYRSPGALEDHMKIHDNELISCSFCPYTTVNMENQQLIGPHINAHFKIRPFKCSFCDASFFRSTNVKNHEEARHDIIKDRYNCDKCDFVTYTRQILVNHKRKHK